MVVTLGFYGEWGPGVWRNPIAQDLMGHTLLNAQVTQCAGFEVNYFRCLEAFGHYLGMRYCDLEFRDFQECVNNTKKIKRVEKIREERKRQFLMGDRDRPFIRRYPPTYACYQDWYDKNRIF